MVRLKRWASEQATEHESPQCATPQRAFVKPTKGFDAMRRRRRRREGRKEGGDREKGASLPQRSNIILGEAILRD